MLKRICGSLALLLVSSQTYAFTMPRGHLLFEGGGYYSTQGQSQNVGIATLIGDTFTVTNRNDWGSIFGVGYLFEGPQWGRVTLDYGVNIFYLAKTKVSGTITQEHLFTNLAFNYYADHMPLYAMVKALVKTNCEHLSVAVDAGVGPNFMETTQYTDMPLNSYTLPDNAFRGHSNVVFSAMVGIGVRYTINNTIPVEIGYRFFYLGQGYLNQNNTAVLNQLHTGTNYAQAVMVTVSI